MNSENKPINLRDRADEIDRFHERMREEGILANDSTSDGDAALLHQLRVSLTPNNPTGSTIGGDPAIPESPRVQASLQVWGARLDSSMSTERQARENVLMFGTLPAPRGETVLKDLEDQVYRRSAGLANFQLRNFTEFPTYQIVLHVVSLQFNSRFCQVYSNGEQLDEFELTGHLRDHVKVYPFAPPRIPDSSHSIVFRLTSDEKIGHMLFKSIRIQVDQ